MTTKGTGSLTDPRVSAFPEYVAMKLYDPTGSVGIVQLVSSADVTEATQL